MARDTTETAGEVATRIVGVGSPHGDDRVGWAVASRFAAVRFPRVQAVTIASPIGLLDLLGEDRLLGDVRDRAGAVRGKGHSGGNLCGETVRGGNACGAGDRLIVCDAFAGEGPVGRLQRWDWPDSAIESVRSFGTHDVSLATALELAGNLGLLPSSVIVWGIDVGPSPRLDPFGSGVGEPSRAAALESAVGRLVRRLVQEVNGA